MSDRNGATETSLDEQGKMIRQIALSIVDAGQGDWTQVRYRTDSLVAYQEHAIYFRGLDGSDVLHFPPDELVDLSARLRAVMYRPGAGTWFSATITVTAAGAVDADFDYDDEPNFDGWVDSYWYVQDLEKFPRDEEARPEWLRQRLSEAFTA